MKLKAGVSLQGVQWQMFHAAITAEAIYQEFGLRECVITSANDGKHGKGTLHHSGLALDLRIWHIAADSVLLIAKELRKRLGPDYDCVVEEDHIHLEVSDSWLRANGDPR